MKFCLCSCLLLGLTAMSPAKNAVPPPAKAARLYEMRVYYAEPGKLDGLLARFRNHTTKLFQKHGMANEGYWLPLDNKDNKLVYLLSYPDSTAREKAWQGFLNDPAWKQAAAKSEEDGKLVARIESFFLTTTDFSPRKIARKGTPGRVFELRTYTATAGNLPRLLGRFRDHTTALFQKHGMTNLWYFTYAPGRPDADRLLVYLLAHPSREAGLAAFDAFRQDPAWQAARNASEQAAGGSLTTSVVSEYLVPTDFSPVR